MGDPMLASQRHLFEMPRQICYLNSASYSPSKPAAPQSSARAGHGRWKRALPMRSTNAPAPPRRD
jgi:hypothetical protein